MLKANVLIPLFLVSLIIQTASAAPSDFTTGPVFKEYGENTQVSNGLTNPEDQHLKVVFDISDQAQQNTFNRNFNTVARFINMHVRAGVPKENVEVAMIIHGKASFDLMNDAAYSTKFNQPNPSTELVNLLSEYGVEIFICGQSASYNSISLVDLNQNVEVSLSAMTANALLQQKGYTLNPF